MALDGSRPLGNLERWFLARNHIQFYTNVQVTTRLSVPTSLLTRYNGIKPVVYLALRAVITNNPILGVVVENESDLKTSRWKRVDAIDLDQHTTFAMLESKTSIDELLEGFNRLPIDRIERLPLWRVVVTSESSLESKLANVDVYYISFIFHHAICDGLSGCAFHVQLLEALNDLNATEFCHSKPSSDSALVNVSAQGLVDNIEKRIDFSLGLYFTAKAIFNAFVFSRRDVQHWGATAATQVRPPRTSIRSFTISSTATEQLREACRSHGATIAALVSVIVARKLAIMYPQYTRFTGSILFSLREQSGISPLDMGLYFAAVTPPPKFSSEVNTPAGYLTCRSQMDGTVKEDSTLWDAVAACKRHLTQHAQVHNNSLGLIRYAGDLDTYMRGLLGRPREVAFEVTNVGLVDGGSQQVDDQERAVFDKILLSGSMSSVGPAYCVHLATIVEGDMSVLLGWEAGVVRDDEAEDLAISLEAALRGIAGA